jgi:uncharacterized protein YbjT (DUF2867 family)
MKIVILGGSGAVGASVIEALLPLSPVTEVHCLVRSPLKRSPHPKLRVHQVDLYDAKSYQSLLKDCHAAIITLGVGQPSKVSQQELYRTDYECAQLFASCCRSAQCASISVLTAILADPDSSTYYLKVKGMLELAIENLAFKQTFFFQPSMLMTDQNRYDWVQGLALKVLPVIDHALIGPMNKFRSIHVRDLGWCMALNAVREFNEGSSAHLRRLRWPDFQAVLRAPANP